MSRALRLTTAIVLFLSLFVDALGARADGNATFDYRKENGDFLACVWGASDAEIATVTQQVGRGPNLSGAERICWRNLTTDQIVGFIRGVGTTGIRATRRSYFTVHSEAPGVTADSGYLDHQQVSDGYVVYAPMDPTVARTIRIKHGYPNTTEFITIPAGEGYEPLVFSETYPPDFETYPMEFGVVQTGATTYAYVTVNCA